MSPATLRLISPLAGNGASFNKGREEEEPVGEDHFGGKRRTRKGE